ncbi:hypothetical protein F2Q68_00040180 [Brassica cretica]|uniref:Uncharacterized protein n=1 Tax=Brassica cretica TaxID=69181 RepID=A0A8S9MC64_BRACR|nr:hypothetical protein F2Q68_00040180 [Brassica cretica]
MSRLSQDALSKDKTLKTERKVTWTRDWLRLKETCSTLLEVSVTPWWPFKTSEHTRYSCWSKGDATWLVHEWACDQMDQLVLSYGTWDGPERVSAAGGQVMNSLGLVKDIPVVILDRPMPIDLIVSYLGIMDGLDDGRNARSLYGRPGQGKNDWKGFVPDGNMGCLVIVNAAIGQLMDSLGLVRDIPVLITDRVMPADLIVDHRQGNACGFYCCLLLGSKMVTMKLTSKSPERTRIQTDHGKARVWQSDHGQNKLGHYVATELKPRLGHYVATELEPKLSRYARAKARSLRSDQARTRLDRYVAIGLSQNFDTTRIHAFSSTL